MKDRIAEIIITYEHFQEMPLELSANIDAFLEEHPGVEDAEDTRKFLADRFNALQDEIEAWRDAQSMAECTRRLPGVQGVPVEQKEESYGEER